MNVCTTVNAYLEESSHSPYWTPWSCVNYFSGLGPMLVEVAEKEKGRIQPHSHATESTFSHSFPYHP